MCTHCFLRAGGPGRLFSHQPGDSRLLSFLGGSEVIFHTVSLDLFSDISVLAHNRARSKPTYTVSVLLATDIISGAICLNIIDNSKAVSVIQGLKLIALKYIMPQRLIVDAGSQLVSLKNTNKDLLEALANHHVQVTSLPAGHQFGNTIERLVQILKQIFNSLREDTHSSIYAQKQTLQELYGKLMLIESIMNSRPILSVSKSQEVMMLTPKQMMSPFLT